MILRLRNLAFLVAILRSRAERFLLSLPAKERFLSFGGFVRGMFLLFFFRFLLREGQLLGVGAGCPPV